MIDWAKYPKFANDSKMMKRIAFLEVEWRRAYPSVNFESQVGWAHSWLITSGKKYFDMGRFINNWLKRCAQDLEKAHSQGGPIRLPAKPYKEPQPEGDVMGPEDFQRMREAIKCKPTLTE